jgi:hypothetical protein
MDANIGKGADFPIIRVHSRFSHSAIANQLLSTIMSQIWMRYFAILYFFYLLGFIETPSFKQMFN